MVGAALLVRSTTIIGSNPRSKPLDYHHKIDDMDQYDDDLSGQQRVETGALYQHTLVTDSFWKDRTDRLIAYLIEQTSLLEELESILADDAGPQQRGRTSRSSSNHHHDPLRTGINSTTHSVIDFLRDLQKKNKEMIYDSKTKIMESEKPTKSLLSSSPLLPFVSSSPARVSYEQEDIRPAQQGRTTTARSSTASGRKYRHDDETAKQPAATAAAAATTASTSQANYNSCATTATTTSPMPISSRGETTTGYSANRRGGNTKATNIVAAASDPSNSNNSSNRLVHFDDLLLGDEEPSEESLLISSIHLTDDDEEVGSSSAQHLPPTVIASPRKPMMAQEQLLRPSSRLAIMATTLSPVPAPRSRKKTLCPPRQVRVSTDTDSSMSFLSEIGVSPLCEASYRRPSPYAHNQDEPVVAAADNKCDLEDDSWSTETPFFDRFRVDYDPNNPRQVIVRPNPRQSRRGKLAERQILAAQRRQQQQLTIDENAPLDLSSKPSPQPRRQQQQRSGHSSNAGRFREVFRVDEAIVSRSPTVVPPSQHVSFAADNDTTDHDGSRRASKSLLLYAEAQLANIAPVPQILPIGRDEYNAAPRLVHLQVSLDLLEAVIDTLNEKIADFLQGQSDHQIVKRMHISETDLLLMCRGLLSSTSSSLDNDHRHQANGKNILSALCYFQRLWMRTPFESGTPAVFDIIFDDAATRGLG